jgi:hypothetical protein
VRDPLTSALRAALAGRRTKDLPRFLRLFGRQLAALERLARVQTTGPMIPVDKALARRVLRGAEELWNDGDENLVRGHLDRFVSAATDARAQVLRLHETAKELAAIGAPPGAVAFFAWEMQSMLTSPGDLAMIAALKAGQSRSGGR